METPENKPMVGNDADEHGCKPSTGYQWSELKQTCIRIFEDGIRLDAQAEGVDKTTSAFAVFKSTKDDDDAKVEIFVPSEPKSFILVKNPKNEAGEWTGKYTLTQYRGMYSLVGENDKVLYAGMAVRQ